MTISGPVVGKVESFRYSGSFVQRDGNFVKDVKCRIKCGKTKRREESGTRMNKKILVIRQRSNGTIFRCYQGSRVEIGEISGAQSLKN